MCVFVYVCIYIYMCVYVSVYIYIYIYIFLNIHLYSLVLSITSCTKVFTKLLSHIRHAFIDSRVVLICPCMALLPGSCLLFIIFIV